MCLSPALHVMILVHMPRSGARIWGGPKLHTDTPALSEHQGHQHPHVCYV